jgi:hypothetical protein
MQQKKTCCIVQCTEFGVVKSAENSRCRNEKGKYSKKDRGNEINGGD